MTTRADAVVAFIAGLCGVAVAALAGASLLDRASVARLRDRVAALERAVERLSPPVLPPFVPTDGLAPEESPETPCGAFTPPEPSPAVRYPR